jgi:hypothetical protein
MFSTLHHAPEFHRRRDDTPRPALEIKQSARRRGRRR